jgi:hypothetical protein
LSGQFNIHHLTLNIPTSTLPSHNDVTIFQPLSPMGAEGGHRLDELIDQNLQPLRPWLSRERAGK